MTTPRRALLLLLLSALSLLAAAAATQPRVTRVEPPNWWEGMQLDTIRLLLTGEQLDGIRVRSRSAAVRVLGVLPASSPGHAFVDIAVGPGSGGSQHQLLVLRGPDTALIRYPVLRREPAAGRFQGFSPDDVIYLITPDRFANGDPSNDTVEGMPDSLRRSEAFGRHGGDIQGMLDRLDYLRDLGVTALWINPLVENNMPRASYHGYAATDLYRIDPRFGTNTLFTRLAGEAHARGLKIIMDHVTNHIGIAHPWIKDLPTTTWLNGSVESHDVTHHAKTALVDPHADTATLTNVVRGWFNNGMPDLNQEDPSLASYIIQNTIWWIESTGLDGIREDTYPYADIRFMERWSNAITREYPRLTVVGEIWTGDPVFLAPFQRGSRLVPGLRGSLYSITDFALYDAIRAVFGGTRSMHQIYECLAKDVLYPDPQALMTFADNHDVPRILQAADGDSARTRLALTLLLTTRGIPQLYYGTEIAMRGGRDHGAIRADFPGGFPGDARSAFTREGRTESENRMFDFTRALLRVRKAHPALRGGSLVQFPPRHEVYVYFRKAKDDTVMVILNNDSIAQKVKLGEYRAHVSRPGELLDLQTGEPISGEPLRIPAEMEVTVPARTGLVLGTTSSRR